MGIAPRASKVSPPALGSTSTAPIDKALSQLGEPGLLPLFALFLRGTQFVGNPAAETFATGTSRRRPTSKAVDSLRLAARGESPAQHRGRRGAPLTRRDDREYREYLREEQRSQPGAPTARTVRRGVERGCLAGRMQP